MNPIKEAGRIVAGAYYDHQEVRLSAMNRMRDVIRKKNEGIEFDEVEDKKKAKKYDKKYQDANLAKTLKEMYEKEKLTEKEFGYIQKMLDLARESVAMENRHKNLMMAYIGEEDMWNNFLLKVKGLGPVLAANLIKSFGYCERYGMVSSLWKHCGYDVNGHGTAPKRRKGEDITFSPKMRTMCWKVADSFIKQNSPVYREIYDREKKRQLAIKYKRGELFEKYGKPYTEDDTKLKLMHAHNRALRKMVKIFLQHYWIVGRKIMKLPVSKPYPIDRLKHIHYITWQEVVQANEDLEDAKHRKGVKK